MKNYKGNMLLIEFVIVILFFALSQVVLVQVFADAHRRTVNTARLNQALAYAENTAEVVSVQSPRDALVKLGYFQIGEEYLYTGIDGVELYAYLETIAQPSGQLFHVEIRAERENQTLFTLPSARYLATEVE